MSEKRGPYLVGGTQSTDAETLAEIAEDMAAAIREWEQYKKDRLESKPVGGMIAWASLRRVDYLLMAALKEYDDYTQMERTGATP